jgi:hypothetical protein
LTRAGPDALLRRTLYFVWPQDKEKFVARLTFLAFLLRPSSVAGPSCLRHGGVPCRGADSALPCQGMDELVHRCWWCRREIDPRVGCPPCARGRRPLLRWVAGLVVVLFTCVHFGMQMRENSLREFGRCEDTVEKVATGLTKYSCDPKGHYPDDLSALIPTYFHALPKCPAAAAESYGYLGIYQYQVSHSPIESYTLTCDGHHHRFAGIPQCYPQYTSIRGLLSGH